MGRLLLLLFIIALGSGLVTVLLHYLRKNVKWAKYVPAIVSLGASIYYFYLSRTTHTGLQDLGNILLSLMAFTSFISGIFVSLFIDIYLKRK